MTAPWYIVMICGAVGGVFLGFVAGALAGLWIMGDGAPEDCPAAQRKPMREEPPEQEGDAESPEKTGEVGPVGQVGQVPAPSWAGEKTGPIFGREPHPACSLEMLWGWTCGNCRECSGNRCRLHLREIERTPFTTCDSFAWGDGGK